VSTFKARVIQEDEVYISVKVNLDGRGSTGYTGDLELYNKDGQGWVAHMNLNDMPPQASFEEAVDRLGLYMKKLSVALKGKNVKSLNPEPLFKHIYK